MAVTHALLLQVAYPGNGSHSCLTIKMTAPGLAFSMAKPEASKALADLVDQKDRIHDQLPGNPADLWDWCMNRTHAELVDLLAYVAASSLDATRNKSERADSKRLVHGDHIAHAVSLDMTKWYAPTAEGYFNRIRRNQILASIDEAKGGHGPALEKLKKAEFAARAEAQIAGTGWLPEPLRVGPASDALADTAALAAE